MDLMAVFFSVNLSLFLLTTINAETIDCRLNGKPCSDEVRCANNEDCTVNCYDCAGTTIYCPTTTHQCNITCAFGSSCKDTIIDAISFNSSLAKLTITAKSTWSTWSTTSILSDSIVKCPSNHGQCNLHCEGDNACENIVIDGSASLYTNISLTAIGDRAFYNSSVYVAPYGTLHMDCNGDDACRGTNPIQSHGDTLSINLKGTGSYVLAQSTVYCPNNADFSTCNIDLKGNGGMQDTNIYATESFNDINFLCDASFDEGCNGITMFCGDGYSSSCSMLIQTSQIYNAPNDWQCMESTSICNIDPSSSTTSIEFDSNTGTTDQVEGFESVELTIEFSYIPSDNDTHISLNMLERIFSNKSDDLLAADISRIADSCVEGIDYAIDIDEQARRVIVDAMIYVCNTETLSVLMHLADITVEEVIVIDIRTDTVESTMSYVNNQVLMGVKKHNSFGIITAIFGSVICIGVIIVGMLCFFNIRKDIKRNQDGIGNSSRYGYRIDTMSKTISTRKYNHADQDEKQEEYMDDPVEEAEPLTLAPGSLTDINNGMDINIDIGAMELQISTKCDDTLTPYDPGSPKHMMDDTDVNVVMDEMSMKQWLQSVALPEYYLHFVAKGYYSLDTIQQIDSKEQLEEIGIFVEKDIIKLLKEIKKLSHEQQGEMHKEGIPNGICEGDMGDVDKGSKHNRSLTQQTVGEIIR